MVKREKKNVKIVYSCLTGKAVWVYIGPTDRPRMSYWRASQAEIERFRRWNEIVAERKAWIRKLLNSCMEKFPMMNALPEEKRRISRRLLTMAEEKLPFHSEFYKHVMEERRRRAEDRKIRQQMREWEKAKNNDYDK